MKRLLVSACAVLLSVFFFNINQAQAATAATVAPDPLPYVYPATAVGGFSDQVFTIQKATGGFLDPYDITAVGFAAATTHFSIVGDTCTNDSLNPVGDTCTVTVRFAPTATGAQSATVNITAAAGDTSTSFGISGTGLPNATVKFGQPVFSVNEANATVSAILEVTRTGDTGGAGNVTVNLADGTATGAAALAAGIDYVNTSLTFTFAVGQASAVQTVAINGDTNVESTENFTATIASTTIPNVSIGSPSVANVNIQDNDSPPAPGTLSFNPDNYIVNEATASFDICITRSDGSDGSVDVDYTVLNGTAVDGGTDYTLASGTKTFVGGDTVECMTVTVVDDAAVETNETFTVVLSNPTGGATLGPDSVVTVTIIDNDAATPTVAFDSASYSVGEAGGSVTLTLVRSGDLSTDFDVDVVTYDGTAVDPTEYTGVSTTVNFAPGEVIKTVNVSLAADDAIAETTLTFFANLESLVNNSGLTGIGAPNFVPVNILDDDGPTTFSMGALTYFFGEGSIAQLVTVNRSGDTANTDTVDLTATDVTATTVTDYAVTPTGTLTFNPGETSKNILVTLVGDSAVEANETFTLTLSAASAGTAIDPLFDVSTVTIVDDDGTTRIEFDKASYFVSEAAGTASIVVTRSGNTSGTVSVDLIPTSISATSGGVDFTVPSVTVTFGPGETSQFVIYTLNNDGIIEPTETFLLVFDEISLTAGAVLGSQSISEVSILDDDSTSAVLQFAQPTYTFGEGGISGIVTVTRSGNTTSTVSVDFFHTDLTATDGGIDYDVTDATLTFNPGEITKTIQIDLNDDADVEATETFRLTLDDTSLTGGAVLGPNAVSDVSIIDNEGQATVQFGQANYVVSEGIGTFTAIVTRSGDTSQTVSVDVVPVDVTAVNGGTDYTLANPESVTFAPGETTQTISISIFDDSTIEQTESFLLTFDATSLTSSAVLGPVSTSQVDIVDNDGNATVEFKKDLYSFGEGLGQGIVFAVRSGDASQLVTVPISVTDVTATGGGTDYDVTTTSLTFGVGESVKTLLVDLTPDTDIEPTESFLLEIGAPTTGSAILGVNSIAEVDILDDDGASTFDIENAEYVIGEGGVNLAVTVVRSGSTAVSQDVDLDTADVSALAGTDYTAASSTLTFAAGVTSQTALIGITEDSDIESNETFTVALSNPTAGAVLGLQSTSLATIVDNDGDATIEFNPANYVFSEGLGIVTIKVVRSGDASSTVTVPFAVAPVSAGTPADFTVTTASPLVFGVGVTSQTILVTLADDVLIEPTESFVVTLAPPTTGSAVLGVDSTADIQIVDNDGDAAIEFSKPIYNFDEGSGTVTVLAIRSGDSSGTVGASFAAVDVSATAADYAVVTGSPLSFGPFVTALPITITLTDDTEVEPTETFNLLLSAPTGGAVLGANSAASVAIDDNDNAGILAFSSDAFAFNENIGTAAITVTRTGGSDGAVSVDCSTLAGTATAPADFTALSGSTISWVDGDTAPKTCDVTIADDILEEGLESFTVTLSDATGEAVVGSTNVATVQIVDNDDPGEIAFSDDTYEVEEGGGSITVTVLRKTGTTGTVTVDYETVPGTATSPDDFTSTSGTLTWNDGDNTPRVISIPIGDTDTETLKTFSVVLSAPTGGATLTDPSVAEVHIGFGAPTVPNSTDGGGCSLTPSSSNADSAPMWLLLAGALSLAFFRTRGRALRTAAMIALSSVFLMAGGSTGCNKRPPVPTEAVAALERLIAEAQSFLNSFNDVETCEGLNKAVADLNADQVIPCDTGEIQASSLVTECNDGPFSGTATVVGVAQNCVDTSDGTTLDGTLTYTIHTDGTKDVTLSSAGATVNGINYPVGGVTVTTSGGATTCEGVLTVLELPCTVTADCSTCEFLD